MDHRTTAGPTLLVLVGICALMAFFGLRTLAAGFPDNPISSDSGPYCIDRQVAAGTDVYPQDVMVTVFNSGTKAGTASKIMASLVERGFVAGETGNRTEAGVAAVQVMAKDPTGPAARLVAQQFGAQTAVVPLEDETGPGVVVIVGDQLGGLGPAVAKLRAEADTTVCAPPLDATS